MARPTEPDIEFDPRHRIVGAIILVTLAVIVLPLILDERPAAFRAAATDAVAATEAEPAKAAKIVVKKLGDDKPVSATTKSEPIPVPVSAKAETKPQAQETRVVIKKLNTDKVTAPAATASKPEAKVVAKAETATPTPAKSTSPAITAPHWAVQVGTFSNQGNVRRLSKQLKEHGYSLMLKDVNLKQGSAVRVRVGPYTTKASADRAQDKIRQQIGVKGVVVAGP